MVTIVLVLDQNAPLKEIRLKSIDNEFFRSVTLEIIEESHSREKYLNNIEMVRIYQF